MPPKGGTTNEPPEGGTTYESTSPRGLARKSDDDLGGFEQALDAVMRRSAQRFVVLVVDQNGRASGGVAAVDVAPAVAHHETGGQVDAQLVRGPNEQARARLAKLRGRLFVPGVV